LRESRASHERCHENGGGKQFHFGGCAVMKHARKLKAGYKSSVAIGHKANDRSLLAAAQLRFAIRNPRRGHHETLVDLRNVTALEWSGRELGGWQLQGF
jgi:hypothetical protein